MPGAAPTVKVTKPPSTPAPRAKVAQISSAGASRASMGAVAIAHKNHPQPSLSVAQSTIRSVDSEPAPVVPLVRRRTSAPAPEPARVSQAPEASVRRSDPGPPASPPRPPVLASKLLADRIEPTEPGLELLRRGAIALGAAGLLASVLTGGLQPLTWACALVMAAIITLAATPMSYAGRATGLFIASLVMIAVGAWQQELLHIVTEAALLSGATVLLGGSLVFRAYHRAARLARWTVMFGVLALAAWFVLAGGLRNLVTMDAAWQSWAPAMTTLALGVIGLLSMLAFMDGTTRAGAHLWAPGLLVIYVLHIGVGVGALYFGLETASAPSNAAVAAVFGGVICTLIGSLALAQILVSLQLRLRD